MGRRRHLGIEAPIPPLRFDIKRIFRLAGDAQRPFLGMCNQDMKSRPDSIGSDRIMGNLKHLDGIGTGESGSLLRFDIKKFPDRISFE